MKLLTSVTIFILFVASVNGAIFAKNSNTVTDNQIPVQAGSTGADWLTLEIDCNSTTASTNVTGFSKAYAVVNWEADSVIPQGSTINNVRFSVTRQSTGNVSDFLIGATSGGVLYFASQDPNPWSSSYTTQQYLVTPPLTWDQVANISFGVALQVSGNGFALISCISLNITYTPPVTSGLVTTSPATSGRITTGISLTSGLVTTSPATSGLVTTSPATSGSITTGVSITTGSITTNHVTTGRVTTSPLTSNSVTSGSVTTGSLTSGHITSSPVTTIASTTRHVTTAQVSQENSSESGNKTTIAIAVPVAIVGILAIVVAIVIVNRRLKSSEREKKRMASSYGSMIDELGLTPVRSEVFASVKEVGVSSDQNPMYRRTMEDEHIVVDKFGGDVNQFYVAVYDGHGGKAVAEIIKEKLHKNFEKELKSGKSVEQSFNDSFARTDEEIMSTKEKSGSTAAVAFIGMKDGKKILYTANCGDARIVLKRGTKALRMTIDHKASSPDEQKRIKDLGGIILGDKVAASLAVTRAFGDCELKEWVKAEPYINSVALEPTDTHLIVACDGLWDVVSDEEAVSLIGSETAQQLSAKLLKTALDKLSKDNVSVVVIRL